MRQEREREREREKKIERAHVPVRSCAPAESAPSSLVSCWYCAIRRTAVTNSHEIRIVVREMAAITSGRRKQGLSPFLCRHNPQKQLTTPRSKSSLSPSPSLTLPPHPERDQNQMQPLSATLLYRTWYRTGRSQYRLAKHVTTTALAQHSLQAYACSFVACSRRMLTPHAQKLACTMWRTRPHSLARGQAIGSDPRKVGSKSTR